jgi:hypothetical protein
MPHRLRLLQLALLVLSITVSSSALADSISPYVTGEPNGYSSESPDTANFGNGTGSRQAEASYLRFVGGQDIENGRFDSAIHRLGKALLLDSEDPESHLLYARAMTGKILKDPDHIDRATLDKTIHEWRMLWHHDADLQEQFEARRQALKLTKIAKQLDKTDQSKTATAEAKKAHGELVVEKVITPKSDQNPDQ